MSKRFIGAGHLGKSRRSLDSKVPGNFVPPCKHDSYCSKLQTMPKAHCSEDFAAACSQVKKFYDQYGRQGNEMGVGS